MRESRLLFLRLVGILENSGADFYDRVKKRSAKLNFHANLWKKGWKS